MMNAGRRPSDAISLLQRLIISEGKDQEAAAWCASGVSAWLRFGKPIQLPRCLGLQASPDSVKKALRDALLRQAASMLKETGPWDRAKALARHAIRFETSLWRRICNLSTPPEQADEMTRLLFYARRAAAFPESTQQFYNIITKT